MVHHGALVQGREIAFGRKQESIFKEKLVLPIVEQVCRKPHKIYVVLDIGPTGQACKLRVFGRISHRFPSPVAAETFYRQHVPDRPRSPQNSSPQRAIVNNTSTSNPPPPPVLLQQNVVGISGVINACERTLTALDPVEQLNVLSQLFSAVVERNFTVARIPGDFLRRCAEVMQNLHLSGRSNTIYLLAKALGTKRIDGSDTLLPTKRMPMGLIEYTAAFFTASSLQQVTIPY